MERKITKTYLGSTGTNYKTETSIVNGEEVTKITTTETATFHIYFPVDFVNSTNRRFITVMPPKLVWGGDSSKNINSSIPISNTKSSKIADNYYILHCSFIHSNPYHNQAVINVNDPKRKYKKYEYKGCDDGFDITFTDYYPAFDYGGWSIGLQISGSTLPTLQLDETVLTTYFQGLFTNLSSAEAANLAEQCLYIYYDIQLESAPTGLYFYRNNQRFKKNSTTEYLTEDTDHDVYDIVLYVIEQNGLTMDLQFSREITQVNLDGDYYVYSTSTHYKDPNIDRQVTYTRYTKYKILKDSRPWYYYAEFMVEF